MRILFIIIFIYNICIILANKELENHLKHKLILSNKITHQLIQQLVEEWQIEKYPLFLKSCYMHKSAWEIMKLKYIYSILTAEENQNSKDFIISFLGSSVAAGHDSWFNESYPIVVETYMKTAFESLNLNLISRNVALGNNPCIPYDLCVKIFAGLDADIIHWEQTYNCPHNPTAMEQFVRQAMVNNPNKPIIVYSESQTATWDKKKCLEEPPVAHIKTPHEDELLTSTPIHLVSDLNRDEFKRGWKSIKDIIKVYGVAGIQTFTHVSHEPYKCLGPYVPEWQEGAAKWHPSFRSHRLRAAHHSYFWLLALEEAIHDLLSILSTHSLESAVKENVRKLHGFYYHSHQHSKEVAHRHNLDHHVDTTNSRRLISSVHIPHNKEDPKELLLTIQEEEVLLPDLIYPSPVVDNIQCLTDYEPRSMRESSLVSHVIGGLNKDIKITTESKGWKSIIYENLVDEKLVQKSISKGYKDFKHLLFGNIHDGPLSIQISVVKIGSVMICETPGIWGSLPKGFGHIWDTGTEIFLTSNIVTQDFIFQQDKSSRLDFSFQRENDICMKSHQNVTSGNHALTIIPRNETKIIIAWLLIP